MERRGNGVRLEDLERSMQDMQLPPGLPPGLDTQAGTDQSHTTHQHPATFSIPTNTVTDPNNNNTNLYDDFMTDKEKDIVARLHLSQLRNPQLPVSITDYYYQNMAKRGKKASAAADAGPLYFPSALPSNSNSNGLGQNGATRRRTPAVKATEFKVEGSLGSISKSSHHRPRTQFQAPVRTHSATTTNATNATTALPQTDSNGMAEALIDRCLAMEEAQLRLAEDVEATPQAQQASHDRVDKERLLCEQLLALDDSDWFGDKTATSRLAALLDHQKGRRALSRVIGLLPLRSSLLLCERVLQVLEHVDSLQLAGSSNEDGLLQDLLPQMVACVSKADWQDGCRLLQCLIDKPALPWLLQRKCGLVVACMVLSRLEVLKQADSGETLATDLEQKCEQLYELHLLDHLVDIFFPPITANINNQNTQQQQYTWQLLALVAVNVDGDKKRDMVLELRETVMSVVNSKNQRHIKTMNVFLNALGLDASQLA